MNGSETVSQQECIYGIDFGTSYLRIAKVEEKGYPVIFSNDEDGTNALASAVYFEENTGNVICGEQAKEYFEIAPDRVVQFIRTLLVHGDFPQTIDGKEYTTVEIATFLVKRLRIMAKTKGEKVNKVVFAAPLSFTVGELARIQSVCELAGLEVAGVLSEPLAAVWGCFGNKICNNQNVLVYDLGGMTFQVTVLKIESEPDDDRDGMYNTQVLAMEGSADLGGKDWNYIILRRLFDYIYEALGIDEYDLEYHIRQYIRDKAELMKKHLSVMESTKVRITTEAGEVSFEITRKEFEEAAAPLVTETMDLVEQALKHAGGINIDKVLLVGGACNMPMIRNAVEARFPGKVLVVNPDTAVVRGAALYAQHIGNGVAGEL